MANDRWLIKQISDYQNGNTRFVDTGNELVVYGDDRAHVWKITVVDGSEPAVLSGTATAYFVRADGSTVVVTGTIDGNVVSFQLADECYAVVGYMIGLAKIANSSGTVTIAEKHFRVQSGSTDRIEVMLFHHSLSSLLSMYRCKKDILRWQHSFKPRFQA